MSRAGLVPATPAVVALVAAVAAIPGLRSSVRVVEFFAQPDTRSLARGFIEREIPPGASVLMQPYSAPIHRSRESLVEALRANLGSEGHASIKFQLELAVDPPLQPAYRTIYYGDGGTDADKIYVLPQEFEETPGLSPLRDRKIGYVVLKRANTPNPETAALEAALAREAVRLRTFSPVPPGRSARRTGAHRTFPSQCERFAWIQRSSGLAPLWTSGGSK